MRRFSSVMEFKAWYFPEWFYTEWLRSLDRWERFTTVVSDICREHDRKPPAGPAR